MPDHAETRFARRCPRGRRARPCATRDYLVPCRMCRMIERHLARRGHLLDDETHALLAGLCAAMGAEAARLRPRDGPLRPGA